MGLTTEQLIYSGRAEGWLVVQVSNPPETGCGACGRRDNDSPRRGVGSQRLRSAGPSRARPTCG